MLSISTQEEGRIYIDNQPYRNWQIKVVYGEDTVQLYEIIGENEETPITNPTALRFDEITNPATGNPFASFAALKTFIDDNIYNSFSTTGGGGGGTGGDVNVTNTSPIPVNFLSAQSVTWTDNPSVSIFGTVPVSGNLGITGNPNVTISNASLNVALPAAETHLGEIGGSMSLVQVSLQRPADTNAYVAKDVISDSTSAPSMITFPNAARKAGGSGYIVKARIGTNQAANVAKYRLHLYRSTITAINDNSAIALAFTDMNKRIGAIDFDAVSSGAVGADYAAAVKYDLRIAFTAAPGVSAIYGILETLDAFSPASGQSFWIELVIDTN